MLLFYLFYLSLVRYMIFTEIAFLVPISFVLTIASAITFVDMWHFFSLVTRYENEDKYDYLTGLGNVKEFDRHLNHVSQIAEDKMKVLPYY